MKKFLIPIVIVVLVIAMLAGGYNNLVGLNEDVEGSWAQVQVVLKRRADLIPNLVKTVKGYADQEEKVLTQITEARNKMNSANTPGEYAEADAQLSQGLSSLNVVVEAYPDLKSNQNFLELQAELASTENKISTERTRYNDTVKIYNGKVKRFPTNLYAGMLGFGQKEYFQVNEADTEVPDVDF